jgi:HK97 family phage portal protein
MIAEKLVNAVVDGFSAITSGMTVRQSQQMRLSNPELAKILGVGDYTNSGVTIDHDEVCGLPTVIRGVNILASTVARVPFKVLKSEDNQDVDAKGHTAWYSVATEPNKEFTQYAFRETMTAWAILWGNAVAYIHAPNWPHGEVELIPLLPDRTRMVRVNRNMVEEYEIDPLKEGELYYITHVDGVEKAFHASQCLHIRGLGKNIYWGIDIVDALRETFGGSKAANEFGHRYFGQGANPAGFIESPSGLPPEAAKRFAESIKRGMSGLGKSHRLMLLEEGAKFHQWTVDPEKSQYLEGKQFNTREIAMCLGIKVHKLIDGAGTSYNSLSESNKEHKDDDIMPWLMRWSSEYSKKLLTQDQKKRGTHSITFDDEYMEYISFADKATGVVELMNNGVINKTEARRKVNYAPSLKDENKDRFRKPMNISWEDEEELVRGVEAAPPTDNQVEVEDDEEDNADEEARALLAEMTINYIEREQRRLRAVALGKAKKGGKVFCDWIENWQVPECPKAVRQGVSEQYADALVQLNHIVETACEDELYSRVENEFLLTPPEDEDA